MACGVDYFVTPQNGKVYAKVGLMGFPKPVFELRQVWCLEQLAKEGQNVSGAGQGETVKY